MSNSQPLIRARSSIGDAAVDGLMNGVVAGIVMAIYLILIGVVTGVGVTTILSAFDLGQGTSPVRGVLIHLAMAAIYGIVFSLLYRLIGRGRSIGRGGNVIIGLAYGLLLWLIGPALLPSGTAALLRTVMPINFFIAHVIYGISLGLLSSRRSVDFGSDEFLT